MQRIKQFGTLIAGLAFVAGTIASAEPVTQPAPKKHPECEGSKVKTACNQGEDVKDFVKGRQALTPSTPAPTAPQTSAAIARQGLQPVKDDGAAAEQPK